MLEAFADLWRLRSSGYRIAVTTNGWIKRDGSAVMGRGTAKRATELVPGIAARLGAHLVREGNVPWIDPVSGIVTIPVKHIWNEPADLALIADSLKRLPALIEANGITKLHLPRPGCGNGKLKWEGVRPVCAALLDDRFVVVERPNMTVR